MRLTFTVKQAPLGSHQMIGERFSVEDRGCSFGRAPENDLVMPDPNRYVSSRHATVTFDNDQFSIMDQSANGLFANHASAPIGAGQSFVIKNGTVLKAGEYLLEVTIEAGTPPAVPEPPADSTLLVGDAVAPEAPVVPTPADVPGAGPASEEIALELALRLGLHGMSEEKLQQMPEAVTEVVRSCIAGVMDVLSSRRQVKSQLKMDTTLIQRTHNNALKFSTSAEEAIERMFMKSGDAYLPPETALLEAFQDIADHQVAMMAATIQVYQKVVERFDPDLLEQTLRSGGKEGGLFGGKPRLWDEYRKHYQEIASAGQSSIHDDFVKEFAAAYSEQLQKLKQERGK